MQFSYKSAHSVFSKSDRLPLLRQDGGIKIVGKELKGHKTYIVALVEIKPNQ